MAARKRKPKLNAALLRAKLKLKNQAYESAFPRKHPVAHQFLSSHGFRPGKIREHTAKLIASGALAGSLLMSTGPIINTGTTTSPNNNLANVSSSNLGTVLASHLREILPPVGSWQIDPDKEKKVAKELKNIYGVSATGELEGNRLAQIYGRMGAEQHLPRFPGDSVYAHGQLVEKGITPGRGAWGYFVPSQDQMSPELTQLEKYYVAVPTLYLPDWNTNQPYLKDWYKYRKVVVVNPANGKAIVADIADSGPADWTGKHFGGSPEVMEYLGINYGMQNHPVVLMFLDEKDSKVPVGPLEYNVKEHEIAMKNQT